MSNRKLPPTVMNLIRSIPMKLMNCVNGSIAEGEVVLVLMLWFALTLVVAVPPARVR